MNPTFKTTIIKKQSQERWDVCRIHQDRIQVSIHLSCHTLFRREDGVKQEGRVKNGFIVDKCNELIAEYRRLIEFAGDLSHFDVQMVREFIQEWKVHQNGLNYSALFP